MNLLEEVKTILLGAPELSYIREAGGVLIGQTPERFPLQQNVPYLVLVNGGSEDVLHWSSARRWISYRVEVHCVQRVFEREEVLVGGAFERGVEDIAKDVRFAFDMVRANGRFARNFLRSESPPALVADGNVFLVDKVLTFEIAVIE